MPTLPDRPDLRHLKDQAKDLLKTGSAASLTDAQFQIARHYGFPSWPKIKAYVESWDRIGGLKQAIDRNDLDRIKQLMTADPALHRAELGYQQSGPLTWVAECRIPWEPPGPIRLAMARWMIEHGSDVHQGGDAPLMRAALNADRIPMMELLVANGADVNAECGGDFPIIFAPCETVDPAALRWLLDHGANPNGARRSALDYVIQSYWRSPDLTVCIDTLLESGAVTRYDAPVLDILRGRLDLDRDPELIHCHFPELDFGSTAMRRLTLRGGTLLHLAAEYCNAEAAKLLLDRGADVNAAAACGQTPTFHAASQFDDKGLAVLELLLDRGADLSIRAKLPGHIRRREEVVECTPLGYALLFPGADPSHAGRLQSPRTIALLRERGGLL